MVTEQMASELGSRSGEVSAFFLGGIIGVLIALGIVLLLLILAAVYIYFALAYRSIAQKLKFKKSWLAWIPVAQWAMLLKLGKFHWAWIFLILIPIVGWLALAILLIIAHWRIFEKLKYPGWFSLSMVIPKIGFILYAIAVGIVAWSKKK
ncbi:hypothetical protein J4233_02780 [Candidatus Pacearchaeota archaeon]|nr:hypothetical protein [Candidatus Pacearchaeota archaeon]